MGLDSKQSGEHKCSQSVRGSLSGFPKLLRTPRYKLQRLSCFPDASLPARETGGVSPTNALRVAPEPLSIRLPSVVLRGAAVGGPAVPSVREETRDDVVFQQMSLKHLVFFFLIQFLKCERWRETCRTLSPPDISKPFISGPCAVIRNGPRPRSV